MISSGPTWIGGGGEVGITHPDCGVRGRCFQPGGGTGGGNGGGGNIPVSGRVFWRGMVDDRVQLSIRNNRINTLTVSGSQYPDGTYNFTSPLPRRNVSVDVTKKKGRGDVRVLQQPARSNDFTTIIEISDTDGGAKEYQLEIYWR